MQNNSTWDWFGKVGEHVRWMVRRKVAAAVGDRTRERDVISDMTQEALAAAAERLGEFRGTTEAQFVAWVAAIAEHKLCDHRRAMRRQRRDVRRTRPLAAVGDEVPQTVPLPYEALLRDEERQAVMLLVERLPWRYRTAIRLRYFEEQPVAVVAAMLRCSETAAQGVLKRALVWLRRVASELDRDEDARPSSWERQRPEGGEQQMGEDSGR